MAASSQVVEYRVVHKPKVAVRKEPAVKAEAVGVRKTGDVVRARSVRDGWIELEGGAGWMLIDGKEVGMGMLLEQVVHNQPVTARSQVVDYRVVHKPKVAIRKEPSVKADPMGVRKTGDVVRACSVRDGWIELEGGSGWMLIDGKEIGMGMLLEQVNQPVMLVVMNPLVLGEKLCDLEVAEDWTIRRVKALCAERTGLRVGSMIPARGKMGERVAENAMIRDDQTVFEARFRSGDEFAFIYTGDLERDLRGSVPAAGAKDESSAFKFSLGDLGTTGSSPWIRCLKKSPQHKARVVIFSWTGNRGGQGSAHNFVRGGWPGTLPDLELYEVNWPGRGMRMKEALSTKSSDLVHECANALQEALVGGRPFLFVGFAFGAVVAFEVAAELQRRHGVGPVCLAAISAEGPAWPRGQALHLLTEPEFEEMLREKGGTDVILNDASAKQLYLPVIKADLELEETYTPSTATLSCPVLAVHGTRVGRDKENTIVGEEAAALWLDATSCREASRVQSLDYDWYLLQDVASSQVVAREIGTFAATLL